jgi:hypothetical protein
MKGRNCCNKCENDEQGGGKAKSPCKHKTKNNVQKIVAKMKMMKINKKLTK